MTLTPALLSLGYSAERQQLVLKKGGLRVGLREDAGRVKGETDGEFKPSG